MFLPLLAFALFFQIYNHEPPAVPATTTYTDYPLHIHILNTHWTWMGHQGGVRGYGRANLLGSPVKGIDYTYDCEEPFLHNQDPGEFYQAKWKKRDQEMTLLLQKVGSNKTTKCDIKVSLHDTPYGRQAASPAASGPQAPASPQVPASPPASPQD